MFIMFADIEMDDYYYFSNEKRKERIVLSSKDVMHLFFIKLKMKFFAHKVGNNKKYVVYTKISKNLRNYLIKEEKFKLNKYITKKGKKYYHINF